MDSFLVFCRISGNEDASSWHEYSPIQLFFSIYIGRRSYEKYCARLQFDWNLIYKFWPIH